MNASHNGSSVAAAPMVHVLLLVNTSTIAPTDSNSSNNNHVSDEANYMMYYILGLLLVVVISYVSRSQIPGPEFRQGGLILEQLRRRERRLAERRARRDDPQYRQRVLEKALVVQCITAVDNKLGVLALGEPPGPAAVIAAEDAKGTCSPTRAGLGTLGPDDDNQIWDDKSSACAICLEPFRVGDFVAWSRGKPQNNNTRKKTKAENDVEQGSVDIGTREINSSSPASMSSPPPTEEVKCNHAFHRNCIEQWLLKHEDCPYCRATILYDEDESDDDSNHLDDQPSDAANHRANSVRETGQPLEGDEAEVAASASTASMALVIMNGLVRRASYALFASASSNHLRERGNDHDVEEALHDDRSHPDDGMTSPSLPLPLRDTSLYAGVTHPAARQFRRTRSLGDERDSTRTNAFWMVGERGEAGRSLSWLWRSNAAVACADHSALEEEDQRRRRKQRTEGDARDVAMVSPVRFRRTFSAGPSPYGQVRKGPPYPWYYGNGTLNNEAVGNWDRSAMHMADPVDADTSVLRTPSIQLQQQWSSANATLHQRPSWLASLTTRTNQEDQKEEENEYENHDDEENDDHSDAGTEDEIRDAHAVAPASISGPSQS